MIFLIFVLVIVCALIYYISTQIGKVRYYKSNYDKLERTAQEIAAEFAVLVWDSKPITPHLAKYPDALTSTELFHKISASIMSAMFARQMSKGGAWNTSILGAYKNKIGCEGKYIIEQQLSNIVNDIYNCKYENCIDECDKKIDTITNLMDDLGVNLCEPNLKSAIIAASTKHNYARKSLDKILKYYTFAHDAAV